MLLKFSVKNYKSFRDEMVFSLIPAPKQKGLHYSVLNTKIDKKEYKGLCSAVIYGPNAAGKTNIIGAMDAFKSIVLRGHIRNEDAKGNLNSAASHLELIPNNSVEDRHPVYFEVQFIEENLFIKYSLEAYLGRFLEADAARRIVSEELLVNGENVFSRKGELTVGSLACIKHLLVNAFEQNAQGAIALATSNLDEEGLFLENGFRTMFSAKLVASINHWLENKFVVVYRADSMLVVGQFSDAKKNSIYIEKITNEAAVSFGINSNALGYVISEGEETQAKLCSLFTKDGKSTAIAAETFESYGTIRFVNLFPLVVNVLLHGGTLVVDEFDASIHPMALMSIINIFHNDELNRKNAQLIFNTHNPIFLNANLFRRDEIKFVERDPDTHCSTQYALSDFGTTGKSGVRKNEDYMKNYFVSRYGAINEIDFTPIFKNLLGRDEEE